MKSERNPSFQDPDQKADSVRSVSFVISADHRAPLLRNLCSEILSWIDEVGIQAEVILVARGSHSKTWDVMEEAVRADPSRVVAIRCPLAGSSRAALGQGERLSRGDLVLAMDSDAGVRCQDVRRVLSNFETRFQVIIGKLSSGNFSITRFLKRSARGFFGRDSWDQVGIWGYRRSFAPQGLIEGDFYRSIVARDAAIAEKCGVIDLEACEHLTGLALGVSDFRSYSKGERLFCFFPSSGGAGLLFVLAGLTIFLWGASQPGGAFASICEAMGSLVMLAGIIGCARRSQEGVIGEQSLDRMGSAARF